MKETRVSESGEITATVVVERERSAEVTEEKDEDYARDPSRYLRVYVPLGSELLEASGIAPYGEMPQIDYARERFSMDDDLAAAYVRTRFDADGGAEVFEESGKTVFGGWVAPEETKVILTYRLPFRLAFAGKPEELALVFQKQPGARGRLHFTFSVPQGHDAALASADSRARDFSAEANGVSAEFQGKFESDMAFSITVK